MKKKQIIITASVVVIVLAAVAYFIFGNFQSTQVNTLTVKPTTFIKKVSVSGQVVPVQDVDLGFETAGKIGAVNVSVGDKVSQGSTLAYLSNSELKAALDAQVARLDQIKTGTRPEDVAVSESNVASAKSSVTQSEISLINAIKLGYANADDAVKNKVDQVYTNPRSATPTIIPFDNYTLSQSLNDQRLRWGSTLTSWGIELQGLGLDSYSDTYLQEAQNNLNLLSQYLSNITIAVSSFVPGGSLTQANIDKYKNDVSTARANINNAITAINSADQVYSSGLSAVEVAKNQLNLKKAGATSQDIAIQTAAVEQAQAALGQTVITAPFDGTVTVVNAKTGQIASPNVPVISLISNSNYEIDSYIPETDIAKVAVGQPASITLDAYGADTIFPAKVISIDPAETVKDGVSTYKTKLQFDAPDDRVRSGMTATIGIQIDNRPNVITLPQQAVILKGNQNFVQVKNGDKFETRLVTIGATDVLGNVEIVSGLSVGEIISLNPKI